MSRVSDLANKRDEQSRLLCPECGAPVHGVCYADLAGVFRGANRVRLAKHPWCKPSMDAIRINVRRFGPREWWW